MTRHVQTSEAGAHGVWDGTILVANESSKRRLRLVSSENWQKSQHASSRRCRFVPDASSVFLSCKSRQKIGHFRAYGTAVKPSHSIIFMLNSGGHITHSNNRQTSFWLHLTDQRVLVKYAQVYAYYYVQNHKVRLELR